jgi:isoleucyl-tRNA synthetase
MEEVWLERYPGDDSSIHLTDMPSTPKTWQNEELAAKWAIIRQARRAVTAALEVQRSKKVIGSSLEAYPVVYLEDKKTFEILDSIPFADICITSSIKLSLKSAPETAFSMEEIKGIKVDFQLASGEKCQRCWKILPEVSLKNPVCGRCNEALQDQDKL